MDGVIDILDAVKDTEGGKAAMKAAGAGGAGIAAEQSRSHHVHAGVGALGRKAGSYEALERVGIFEGTDGVGVFGLKRFDGAEGCFFFCHIITSNIYYNLT